MRRDAENTLKVSFTSDQAVHCKAAAAFKIASVQNLRDDLEDGRGISTMGHGSSALSTTVLTLLINNDKEM